MSTKKDANGRIVDGNHIDHLGNSVVAPHDQECTEKAENIFEYLSTQPETQKMQAEKQSHMENPIEVDFSPVCQAGRNDIKAWSQCNKAEWFAKTFRGLRSAVAEELPPGLLYPKEHCSMNMYTVRDYRRVSTYEHIVWL